MSTTLATSSPTPTPPPSPALVPSMGMSDMGELVLRSHYSQLSDPATGSVESWGQIVDRVMDMHVTRVDELNLKPGPKSTVLSMLEKARTMFKNRRVLGSGRSMQFAGRKILDNHTRMYNCTATRADTPSTFHRTFYLLLCGCGVGTSVHRHHVANMPNLVQVDPEDRIVHLIEDSVEGWADAVWVLMASYFPYVVEDDFDLTPRGSLGDCKDQEPDEKTESQSPLESPPETSQDSPLNAGLSDYSSQYDSGDEEESMGGLDMSVMNLTTVPPPAPLSLVRQLSEPGYDQQQPRISTPRPSGVMAPPSTPIPVRTPNSGTVSPVLSVGSPSSSSPDILVPDIPRISESMYIGKRVVFDYSSIRPKGAPISGILGKAPGPEPLRKALENVRGLLDRVSKGKGRLAPIDVFDVLSHLADAVLAGGIRRSAMIILFDHDDDDMLNAKTGNWFIDNPQRARANISAGVLRSDLTLEMMSKFTTLAKQFGEPGVVLLNDYNVSYNPCCEIALVTYYNSAGPSGTTSQHTAYGFCNLTTIDAARCETREDFIDACESAAVIGTLQATYTDLEYLGRWTRARMRTSALVGVSLTRLAEAPMILDNEELLKAGALTAMTTNAYLADLLGINPAARVTTVKPEGTSTIVLGGAGSGIHPVHALRYIRRVQISDTDELGKFYRQCRPRSVETSVWSASTDVISFPITIPPTDRNGNPTRTKANTSAMELLRAAIRVQNSWVLAGTRMHVPQTPVGTNNNVSLTVNVKADEWDDVTRFIYENKAHFTGVSLLADNTTAYRQLPFETVLNPVDLVSRFGVASFFASALVSDVKRAFNGSLHDAIAYNPSTDAEVKIGELSHATAERYFARQLASQRITAFATKFFGGDKAESDACLHAVEAVYLHNKLERECRATGSVDWTRARVSVEAFEKQQAKRQAAPVCVGGACELKRM